jgi:putative methionine-R-sulfoxide reductase with GAF domain
VKSEIVTPIFTRGALYGVIDINSYFADTFNFDEQKFVEACAALVSGYLEKPH